MRFSGGSASSLRIGSRNARSLSLFRASSLAFRVTRGFFKSLLQDAQHGQIVGPSGGLLAFDDIRQAGYPQHASGA